MRPDLYLMRHGETEWNAEGRMQGRLNSHLTETGLRQARRQAELVTHIDADRYSSPQGRAVETAGIIFEGKDFVLDERLREIDVGGFSGRLTEDLRREHPELFTGSRLDWYDRTPDGEHFEQLSSRCRDFLDQLEGPALIVTHGITLHMLLILSLDLPLSRIGEIKLEQGAIHVLHKDAHEVWR